MIYDNDRDDLEEGFGPYEGADDELDDEYIEDELVPGEALYDDMVDEEEIVEEDDLYDGADDEEGYDPFGSTDDETEDEDDIDSIIEERDRREY